MESQLAALREAFGAAGLAVPEDPVSMALADLNELVADKQLRAACKSALSKLKRAAADPAPASDPVPAAAVPPQMAERLAALTAACEAAGLPVPDDPLAVDLEALDEAVADKRQRAQIKSAVIKLQRLARESGWQPGEAAAAAVSTGPGSASDELWLLTADRWEQLGHATRVPQATDELVGQQTAAGLARITAALVLDGAFSVPANLINTTCYLAHQAIVYKAYFLSHVGDTRKGTRVAHLKVEAVWDAETFLARGLRPSQSDRPTGDEDRRRRFGPRYEPDRDMFAEPTGRLT